MNRVSLQEKTCALESSIDYDWFENELTGLERTRFHSLHIPLKPFHWDWDGEPEFEEPELTIDRIALELDDPKALDGIEVSSDAFPEMEASVYIAHVHNPVVVESIHLSRISPDTFLVSGTVVVDFDGTAENEEFRFQTLARLNPDRSADA